MGFGFFASVTGFFCYGGLVGGFFATVGVGFFLRQWKGFWLRQGRLFPSVGVFCDGSRGLLHRHRSAAERSIKKANLCAIAGCHCWAPLLDAIAGCHCWGAIAGVPPCMPLLGAIAGVPWPGCHGWMLATNWFKLGAIAGCHC